MPAHIGADSLKKSHHIVTLRFSEVVKDHAQEHAERELSERLAQSAHATYLVSVVAVE